MLSRVRTYASFIRFSHSVFALPFALVGAILAARTTPFTWDRLIWIVLCMVSARSAAMGFNRLVDAGFDARNPRTAMRELPAGRMSVGEAKIFVGVSSVVFIASSYPLGGMCFVLSPVALAIVFWYSLAKRVTSFTQAFLGLAMAVAPVGGWLAAGGAASALEPWILGLAIGCWVGGFDILYACQDVDFDRREGLHSIPTRFGVARSITISRALHVLTIVALVAVGVRASLGPVYAAGVALVALLLVWEQSLVSASDLSQVKRAFDMNGWVGVLYLATTALAVYWR
ncbi:MAG TPA: UbiA-like polyprenyltransferase [Vicinamibacterales bacterium]|nr:UbiA-like polyprenyltransferase [Vicinamibacterales bacterium]